jgi:hypothetical protein
MSDRTVTRSVEADVEPDVIVDVLIDAKLIPKWAPAFADTIEADTQDGWRVTKGGSTFSIQVAVARSSRTVDYLRETAPGKRGGAYIRVLQRPKGGSVVVMTLPLPTGVDAEKVAAILTQELTMLVNLSEMRTDAQHDKTQ